MVMVVMMSRRKWKIVMVMVVMTKINQPVAKLAQSGQIVEGTFLSDLYP